MAQNLVYQELALTLRQLKSHLGEGKLDGTLWHQAQLLWQERIIVIVDEDSNPQHQRFKTELYRSWRLLTTAIMFAQMNKTPDKWQQVEHHLQQVIGYCESIT
ncbi:MAG: heterocyst frequency control protein PatD [Synechococcaceae cyanobacterium RL_1_2]|nr:heterocyst frequency control protein PatD [Synechococcaceae cyanobacterium RL_1_2]